MAVGREHRRLVVSQMRQTVGAARIAAHGLDQAADLPRAARHQRALERGQLASVQQARRDADHVLGCRADLVAGQVAAVVKADQLGREGADQFALKRRIGGVDHHAVGDAAQEILNVPRPDPHGTGDRAQFLPHDLGQTQPCFRLQPFHAQHEFFPGKVAAGKLP